MTPLLPSHARAAADFVASVGIPAAVELLKPEALAAALQTLGVEYERLSRFVTEEMDQAASADLPPDGPTGQAGGPSEPEPESPRRLLRCKAHGQETVHLRRVGEERSVCGVATTAWHYTQDEPLTCQDCARLIGGLHGGPSEAQP